jgi:uncharacterized membrane protein YphA (DoxX/SURF4 family)
MVKRESDLSLQALRGLRLFLALLLVYAAIGAWSSGQPDAAALRAAIEGRSATLFAPLRLWGQKVLLTNPAALAFLWPILLILCGALLALDIRRRATCAAALLLTAHAWAFGPTHHGIQHLLTAGLLLALAYAKPKRD